MYKHLACHEVLAIQRIYHAGLNKPCSVLEVNVVSVRHQFHTFYILAYLSEETKLTLSFIVLR